MRVKLVEKSVIMEFPPQNPCRGISIRNPNCLLTISESFSKNDTKVIRKTRQFYKPFVENNNNGKINLKSILYEGKWANLSQIKWAEHVLSVYFFDLIFSLHSFHARNQKILESQCQILTETHHFCFPAQTKGGTSRISVVRSSLGRMVGEEQVAVVVLEKRQDVIFRKWCSRIFPALEDGSLWWLFSLNFICVIGEWNSAEEEDAFAKRRYLGGRKSSFIFIRWKGSAAASFVPEIGRNTVEIICISI